MRSDLAIVLVVLVAIGRTATSVMRADLTRGVETVMTLGHA